MKSHFLKVAAVLFSVAFFVFSTQDTLARVKRSQIPEFKYEARLSWAGYPAMAAGYYYSGDLLFAKIACYQPRDVFSLSRLAEVRRGPQFSTGLVSAEFALYFKRWFSLNLNLGFNHLWNDTYSVVYEDLRGKDKSTFVYFLPEAKFSYFVRRNVSLYSSVGVGLSYLSYNLSSRNYEDSLKFDFQLVPIGVSFGHKFFGFVEAGLGTLYLGGKVGVGYRF